MSNVWILAALFLLCIAVVAIRGNRAERLERIRSNWGKRPAWRSHRMDAIAESHASRIANTPGRSLDERTWIDLTLDHIFTRIDQTTSTLGQHALYHRLRTAPVGDHLDAFEALVTRMSVDRAARERAQLALDRLQDPHGYDLWWLARPDAIEPRGWYVVFPILAVVTVLSIAVAPISPGWLIAMLVVNVSVRIATERRIGWTARGLRQFAPLIATAQDVAFLSGNDIEAIVGPLHSDVPKLARLKLISRWINGDPLLLSTGTNALAIGISDIANVFYEYLNMAFLLDANGVYFAGRDVRTHRGSLLRAIAATGDVDAAISVASYRDSGESWTRPQFQPPGATADLVDLRHPLVADPIPNSIRMRSGHGVLVTGSNMSGKSTFLRTVGANAVLAQTINTCLAREYKAPVFDVRSCIGRSDDLLSGKSYYIVEVEALLKLVNASENPTPHLFLLDELFRGTNAVERVAAGQAVLEELIAGGKTTKPHMVLVATHDGELVDLLPASYDAYHFGDSLGPDGLVFDHRLQAGPATTRTAIALLRLHGAPERLLKTAITTAGALDRQRGTTLTSR